MSNENNMQFTEAEAKTVSKLIGAEQLFAIISKRTMLPYVECDQETFDDQVVVFEKPEYLQNTVVRLAEAKNPIDVVVIPQKDRLNFFSSLCTMGVNCVLLNPGTEDEGRIQLDRLVKAPKGVTPDGQPWVENPALHLTAIYFMQAIARNVNKEMTQELADMREEMIAHYSTGNFIIMLNEQGQLPIMKFPNGDIYQPIFTDLFEASKFKVEGATMRAIVPAANVPNILSPESKGVIVNPRGVALQLPIIRQAPNPQQNPQQAPAAAPETPAEENE